MGGGGNSWEVKVGAFADVRYLHCSGRFVMFRLKSSIFTFSVLSIFLLFVIGLAAPNFALAHVEPGELLQASPESLNFVRVIVGTKSSSQTVTATNTSAKKLRIQSVNVSPAFVLTSNNCL